MQIQILKPSSDGKYYPDYDELIKNARSDEEREYLVSTKERKEYLASKGYPGDGFAFGIIYTARMACGHYELFQHPIWRKYGEEPTENNIIDSVENALLAVRIMKSENRKCTSCICGW